MPNKEHNREKQKLKKYQELKNLFKGVFNSCAN